MGFENINKDLTAESVGKADIRELMHNTSGQGRKSVWDTAAEKRFVKYLTTAPKHNSGVAQWPSCAAQGDDVKLQEKLGPPVQTKGQFARVAERLDCCFMPLYNASFLTPGMRKRRVAQAKKYEEDPVAKWRNTAFQGESSLQRWHKGPGKRWFSPDQQDGRKKTQPNVKKDGGKVNFALLFTHSKHPKPKAPPFIFGTNFNAEMSITMMKKQWLPFFAANPQVNRMCMDADPNHPGNRRNQSKVVCEFFSTHLPHIEIIGGPVHWDNTTGEKLTPAEMKTRALGLTKIKGKTTPGHQWNANSPDMNPAEHAVGGVCDKTKIAAGSYDHSELKKIIKKRWTDYRQASLDGSIDSMPSRIKKVIEREGKVLMKGDDY